MKTTPKAFDCVRMKREGAERVQAELKGLSKKEQLEYWERGTKELLAEQAELQQKQRLTDV